MAATNLVDLSLLSGSSSRKQEGNGNSSSPRVNIRRKIDQPTHCRKRHRGKRRPRKENRRRVRPGKSRSGFIAMPRAPFNDNDFLISQRNLEGESAKERAHSEMRSYGSCVGNYVLSLSHSQPGSTCTATAAHKQNDETRSVCLFLPPQKGITKEHVSDAWSWTSGSTTDSSKSTDTSDYSSLESPVDSSSCSTTGTGEDDMCSLNNGDDIFDEDFELRNFEAEYAAQQQQLRDELMKLPRRELEDRYFTLLDQTKVLEERREKSRKMQELELQIQCLEEENRQLRLQQVESTS